MVKGIYVMRRGWKTDDWSAWGGYQGDGEMERWGFCLLFEYMQCWNFFSCSRLELFYRRDPANGFAKRVAERLQVE